MERRVIAIDARTHQKLRVMSAEMGVSIKHLVEVCIDQKFKEWRKLYANEKKAVNQ